MAESEPTKPGTSSTSTTSVSWVYECKKEELQQLLRNLGQEATGTVNDMRKQMVAIVRTLAGSAAGGEQPAEQPQMPPAELLPQSTAPVSAHVCEIVRKWNIQFDGKADPVSFLERLEELKTGHRVADSELLTALPELFRGNSLLWIRNHRQDWQVWQDFLEDFQLYYVGSTYSLQLEEQISKRKQKTGEKGREYLTDIRTLIRRHGVLTPEQELFRVYENLLPEYRQYIRRRDVTDMRTLIQHIEDFERLQQELKATPPAQLQVINTPATSRPTTRGAADASVQCWRCGQHGHFRQNCRNKPKLFCWNCGKDGVLTRECKCRKTTPGNEK